MATAIAPSNGAVEEVDALAFLGLVEAEKPTSNVVRLQDMVGKTFYLRGVTKASNRKNAKLALVTSLTLDGDTRVMAAPESLTSRIEKAFARQNGRNVAVHVRVIKPEGKKAYTLEPVTKGAK